MGGGSVREDPMLDALYVAYRNQFCARSVDTVSFTPGTLTTHQAEILALLGYADKPPPFRIVNRYEMAWPEELVGMSGDFSANPNTLRPVKPFGPRRWLFR